MVMTNRCVIAVNAGTDILDWVMSNLDGANSVEQAQVTKLVLEIISHRIY